MGTITDQVNYAFRDFTTDGVPSSGLQEVAKADVRPLGPLIEQAISNAGLGAMVTVTKTTRALLDADLVHDAGTVALVYADATGANNDLYLKVGASGTGSWTLTTTLHGIMTALGQPYITSSQAAAVLAGHYANDNTNVDVPGGAAGERGARYWNNLADIARKRAQAATPQSWASLSAITGIADGDPGVVWAADAGTHASVSGDAVGTGTGGNTQNAGKYVYVAATPAWKRVGNLDSQDAGVSAASAAASAGAVLTSSLDGTTRAFPALKNIFDKARATVGSYIKPSDGTAVAAGGFAASDFIRVTPGGSVTTLFALFGNGTAGYAFYDINRAWLSGSGAATAAGGTLAVPATGHYMRFTVLPALLDATMVVIGTVAPTAFRAFETMDAFTGRAAWRDRQVDYGGHIENLFDKSAASAGFYLNTATGAVIASGAYFTTQFMPVVEGRTYTANKTFTGGSGYVWFDAAKAFLSGTNNIVAGTGYTAPTGAAYLRMTFTATQADPVFGPNTDQIQSLMVVEGLTFPANYQAFGYADIHQASEVARVEARRQQPPKLNLFNRRWATAGTLLSSAGTTTVSAAYLMTDFIPVRFGIGLAVNFDFSPGDSSYGWNWYDRSQNRIGASVGQVTASVNTGSNVVTVTAITGTTAGLSKGLPISNANFPAGTYVTGVPAAGPGTLGDYTFSNNSTGTVVGTTINGGGALAGVLISPPKGAAYGRISHATAKQFDLVVSDQAVAASAGGFIGWDDVSNLLPWSSTQIALLGDSIMQDAGGNNAFQYGLEHYLRTYAAIWGGVSGRKTRDVLNGSPGGGRGPTSAYVASDFNGVGLTYCNTGTNDFGIYTSGSWVAPRPLGALGDVGATNTFHGDLYNTYIVNLQAFQPTMRIALSTPLPRFDNSATGNPTNSNGVTLQQYADAIIAFGQRYSIPVLDLFRMSGINTANSTTFLLDGLHPNLVGYQTRIVPLVAKWLNLL